MYKENKDGGFAHEKNYQFNFVFSFACWYLF